MKKGTKHTQESKIKIGLSRKGYKTPIETRKKIGLANSISLKGKKQSLETRRKKSETMKRIGHSPPIMKGKDNPMWIVDRTKLKIYGDDNKDRRSSRYYDWRKRVWLRDNFKCKIDNQDCKGRIEVHHILSWKDHKELRYEINNGITLCHFHHPRKIQDVLKLSPYFRELINVELE